MVNSRNSKRECVKKRRAEWLALAGDIKFPTLFQVILENGFCVYAIGGIEDIGERKGLLGANERGSPQ